MLATQRAAKPHGAMPSLNPGSSDSTADDDVHSGDGAVDSRAAPVLKRKALKPRRPARTRSPDACGIAASSDGAATAPSSPPSHASDLSGRRGDNTSGTRPSGTQSRSSSPCSPSPPRAVAAAARSRRVPSVDRPRRTSSVSELVSVAVAAFGGAPRGLRAADDACHTTSVPVEVVHGGTFNWLHNKSRNACASAARLACCAAPPPPLTVDATGCAAGSPDFDLPGGASVAGETAEGRANAGWEAAGASALASTPLASPTPPPPSSLPPAPVSSGVGAPVPVPPQRALLSACATADAEALTLPTTHAAVAPGALPEPVGNGSDAPGVADGAELRATGHGATSREIFGQQASAACDPAGRPDADGSSSPAVLFSPIAASDLPAGVGHTSTCEDGACLGLDAPSLGAGCTPQPSADASGAAFEAAPLLDGVSAGQGPRRGLGVDGEGTAVAPGGERATAEPVPGGGGEHAVVSLPSDSGVGGCAAAAKTAVERKRGRPLKESREAVLNPSKRRVISSLAPATAAPNPPSPRHSKQLPANLPPHAFPLRAMVQSDRAVGAAARTDDERDSSLAALAAADVGPDACQLGASSAQAAVRGAPMGASEAPAVLAALAANGGPGGSCGRRERLRALLGGCPDILAWLCRACPAKLVISTRVGTAVTGRVRAMLPGRERSLDLVQLEVAFSCPSHEAAILCRDLLIEELQLANDAQDWAEPLAAKGRGRALVWRAAELNTPNIVDAELRRSVRDDAVAVLGRQDLPDEDWALDQIGALRPCAAAEMVAAWPPAVAAAARRLSWPELLPHYLVYAARRRRWIEAYARKKARLLALERPEDASLAPAELLQLLPSDAAVAPQLRRPPSSDDAVGTCDRPAAFPAPPRRCVHRRRSQRSAAPTQTRTPSVRPSARVTRSAVRGACAGDDADNVESKLDEIFIGHMDAYDSDPDDASGASVDAPRRSAAPLPSRRNGLGSPGGDAKRARSVAATRQSADALESSERRLKSRHAERRLHGPDACTQLKSPAQKDAGDGPASSRHLCAPGAGHEGGSAGLEGVAGREDAGRSGGVSIWVPSPRGRPANEGGACTPGEWHRFLECAFGEAGEGVTKPLEASAPISPARRSSVAAPDAESPRGDARVAADEGVDPADLLRVSQLHVMRNLVRLAERLPGWIQTARERLAGEGLHVREKRELCGLLQHLLSSYDDTLERLEKLGF